MVISDPYQRKGLGTHLINQLVEVARQEHIERLIAYLHVDNRGMTAYASSFSSALSKISVPSLPNWKSARHNRSLGWTGSGVPTLSRD